MRISRIHIDGFGVWNDRAWDDLSGGVNAFYGPNEAGKTTLMSFVRSVLFGFERRSHPRRYEPRNGGSYGGFLDVVTASGELRIRRKGGRHVRGTVEVDARDGEAAEQSSETQLDSLLGGTTRTLYHNVFAFGLEELEHFRTLEESEVASHISGAGMGFGARRWSQVWKDLEDRRSCLYLPRGQNAVLNQALGELEAVNRDLDQRGSEPEEYLRTVDARDELSKEIRVIEEEHRVLALQIGHYRKVREAEPFRRRRRQIASELGELGEVDSFPEGGVGRLNLLFDQRSGLEADLAKSNQEVANLRSIRQDLARRYTPQDLIRRSRAVESLRLLLPRRDAAEEVVAARTARRDEIVLERKRIQTRQARLEPPSVVSMLLLGALVALSAAGLHLYGYPAARWVGGALLGSLAVWYAYRLRQARRLDVDLADCERRREEADGRLTLAEEEAAQVRASIGRLVGRSDFSHVDLETEAVQVADLAKLAEELRSIEDRIEGEARQRERMQRQLEDIGNKITELLEQGGASSETEFFRRAETYRMRSELLAELARTPEGIVEEPEAGVEPLDEASYRQAVERHEALTSRLNEARSEAGGLEERLRGLSRSEQRSRARLRREAVLARVEEASGKWAVLTLCRSLLSGTRQIYETERQPEVMRRASEFLARMTGGRWTRVISPLEEGVVVQSGTGERVRPEKLSRGTAEQLYLAMRLALVEEYSEHVCSLPVIFDDIFVNFDPERTRRSFEAVRDLSASHQVLLFTCHPHLVRMVQEIVPASRLYPLQ
jgi:uncharacterized protein YhaN